MDGTIQSGPRRQFEENPDQFELVYDERGQPSFFREKTDLLSWDNDVKIRCEPLYPCGLLIMPAAGDGQKGFSIHDIDAARVRKLAEINSPVVLRGFTGTDNRELFVGKAAELGELVPWRSGIVHEVKDLGDGLKGSGGSLTAEDMPFHYDGVFKTAVKPGPDGKDEIVSTPPR